MRRQLAVTVAICLLAGCGSGEPGIRDGYGYAPQTAGGPGVAYFTVHNPGSEAIVIDSLSCPPFARAELHATTVSDGIARMQRVDAVTIAAGSDLALEPGGLHLMLMQPAEPVPAGSVCPLEIGFDDGRRLRADIELAARDGSRH